jgi:hypothetical protein
MLGFPRPALSYKPPSPFRFGDWSEPGLKSENAVAVKLSCVA